MFSNVTSILTMTAMLLHSILGCCAHHAHACEHAESAVRCQAEHDESHCEDSAVAHNDHDETGHKACHAASTVAVSDCRAVAHLVPETVEVNVDEGRESVPHPHQPCQQNCDDGDCRFTQSSVVKTPSPDEGRLSFPVFAVADAGSMGRTQVSALRADSRPPDALAGECRRPMLQVWRL